MTCFFLFKGEKGSRGGLRTGPPGLQGPHGSPGLPGIYGNQGIKGRTGIHGRPGLTGLAGDRGQPGQRGQFGNIGINGNPGILSVINRDTAACKVLGVEYFQNLKKPELTNAKIKILIEEKTDKRKDPSIVPVTETAVVKVIEETALFELKALLIGNTIHKRWLQ